MVKKVVHPTIGGSFVNKDRNMDHWKPLLKEWVKCIELYCEAFKSEDAPYIYTERTNVGLLAGAAWRKNRIALEEFQYTKVSPTRSWDGRVDLYIAHDDDFEEMIEAKNGWINLAAKKSAKKRVEEVLAKAKLDADSTYLGSNVRTLGIAFIPAYIEKTEDGNLEVLIEKAIEGLKLADCDAAAWCFPKEYRRIGTETRYFPGVIMAILNSEIHVSHPPLSGN